MVTHSTRLSRFVHYQLRRENTQGNEPSANVSYKRAKKTGAKIMATRVMVSRDFWREKGGEDDKKRKDKADEALLWCTL